MIKWQDYRDRKLQNPEFKQAYDELEVEYSIRNEILKCRKELGMSQMQLSSLTGIRKQQGESFHCHLEEISYRIRQATTHSICLRKCICAQNGHVAKKIRTSEKKAKK